MLQASVCARRRRPEGREICSAEQRGCAGTEGNHEGGNGARAESRTFPLSSGASRRRVAVTHRPLLEDTAATTWPAPSHVLHFGPMLRLRIAGEPHACAPLQSFALLNCVALLVHRCSLLLRICRPSLHRTALHLHIRGRAKPYHHAKRLRMPQERRRLDRRTALERLALATLLHY